MAQDQSATPAKAPWTKIFTAFKIALDIKKLMLAAAGIFLAAAGWCAIGWTFYNMRAFPEWKNYEDKEKPEKADAQWNHFKSSRASWNLIHELAGSRSPSNLKKEDAGDVAKNREEYVLLAKWEEGHQRLDKPITLTITEKEKTLALPDNKDLKLTLIPADKDVEAALVKVQEKKLTIRSLQFLPDEQEGENTIKVIKIDDVKVKVEGSVKNFKDYRDDAMTLEQIEKDGDTPAARPALKKFKERLVNPRNKPAGLLNVWPWHENRGGNPYLIVSETLKKHDSVETGGDILHWVFSAKALVLLEPLVKFLTPFVYLFDHRAGGWDRLYLIFIIIWTLTIWGFFGGAICRIAAVQLARNERISLREALAFTRERFASYVAAPVFPMALLAIFALVLILFGWIEWIPWFGDVFAGVLWPIVLLIGFMMAIVMVGLIGWPLMVATISTEGTDSFDALSRSYSYVYQAPWQYLWYNFLAVVYGAALVFFVGFMASLMVFVGKWAVSSAPGLADSRETHDREPSYLFYYAPESYGWRNLLLSSSPFTEVRKDTAPAGQPIERREFTQKYEENMTGANRFGAFLVACWIYPLFLLVLGFGYSYFFTASTIIYFLMRHHVDDTEMDEVHMEDEDLDDPFMKATTAPPAPAETAPAGKPGTLSLNVVDAPPPPTVYTADEPPAPPSEPPGPPPETHSPPPEPPAENSPPPTDGHP